jgi:hypothetical protein
MDFENEAYLRVCEPRDRSFLPLKYTYLLFNSGNLYLRLRKMSHTTYAANGKVSHIQQRMLE